MNDDWHEVTLYNNTLPTTSETISVPLSAPAVDGGLELEPDADYYVYDFWNDTFDGRIHGMSDLTQTLRPGEARVLSVHRVVDHPQFLSTNRHIFQGVVDMPAYPVWTAKGNRLSGVSNVVGGETYKIVLALNGYGIKSSYAVGAQSHISPLAGNPALAVLSLDLPGNRAVKWSIDFSLIRLESWSHD